jgi:hypothetical protein
MFYVKISGAKMKRLPMFIGDKILEFKVTNEDALKIY